MRYNPLLLVKDFDCNDELKIDDRFMTNADTPLLAFAGLIENPVNPFTGNPIDDTGKNEPVHYVLETVISDIAAYADETVLPGTWYSLRGSVLSSANWEKIGEDLPEE